MIITENKTFQEISDELAEVLIKQGTRCMSPKGGCMYGDRKGNHCAVGYFMPSENSDLMNSSSFIAPLVEEAKDLGPNTEWIKNNVHLLILLQRVHDRQYKQNRRHNLEHIKYIYKLNIDAWDKWVELGD